MHRIALDFKLDADKLRAMEVFHVAYAQVTDEMRWEARRLLFMAMFGDRAAIDSLFDPTLKLQN